MNTTMPRRPEPELMDLPSEADAYARADFSEVNAAFVGRVLELGGTRARGRVVDLGCGPADIPIRLALARPAWQVTAVEAAPPMLAIARKAIADAGVGPSVKVLQADAKGSGLPAGSFDLVISNSVLHHVSDPLLFWREVRRIAAPQALVLLRDLARPDSAGEAQRLVELHVAKESALLRDEFHRSLLAAYTVAEVRAQLRAAALPELVVRAVSDRHLEVFGCIDE